MTKPSGWRRMQGLRWLCMQSTMKKWFLRGGRGGEIRLRAQIRFPEHVNALGSQPGFSCCDILLLREAAFLSATWQDIPVTLGSQDVSCAFDGMGHRLISAALLRFGARPRVALAAIKELTGCQASVWIPSAGQAGSLNYTSGGCQGGVETPDLFNAVTAHLLSVHVLQWNALGLGFEAGGVRLTHLIRCDNIWTIAKSWSEFTFMTAGLLLAFTRAGLSGKALASSSPLSVLPVSRAVPRLRTHLPKGGERGRSGRSCH